MMPLLIAHEHRLLAEGIAALLRHAGYAIVGRCTDGEEVLKALDKSEPGALVLDLELPKRTGLDILRRVRALRLTVRVVLLCASVSGAQALEAVRLGADGLVLKEAKAEELLECLDEVGAGGRWLGGGAIRPTTDGAGRTPLLELLTPREIEIVRAAAGGNRSKAIASQLGIAEGTVKLHLYRIYRKLDVGNRAQLAIAARDGNIV